MRKILYSAILALSCMLASGQPLIGISSSHSSSGSVSAGDSYIQAVCKAGGIPVVLPLATSEEMAEKLINAVDGIVLTGGEDFDPAWYGEEIINETVKVNAARDSSDIRIVRAAAAAGKPMLGICRGHQAVAVALGGSLYQDIPAQVEGYLAHKQKEPAGQTSQTMGIVPESKLSGLLGGAQALQVNSLHHEAVKVPAPGTRICAATADGVVEACEGTGDKFILTVQFHPEKLIAAGDMTFLPLFKALVEACGR